MSTKWVMVGKILREWGVRGQVKCSAYNPDSDLLGQVESLFLKTSEGYQEVAVESCRPHDQYWRLKFKGYDTPEAAKTLRGLTLALPRERLPVLAPGEIYLADLEGLAVESSDGVSLGTVQGWCQVGDSDALLIGATPGSTTPIPYETDFIASTLLQEGKLVLTDLALELFKINES